MDISSLVNAFKSLKALFQKFPSIYLCRRISHKLENLNPRLGRDNTDKSRLAEGSNRTDFPDLVDSRGLFSLISVRPENLNFIKLT